MGQLKTDGRAVNVAVPATKAVTFGELYRIEGWNGFAMDTIGASDAIRNMAIETAERIWYVKIPAGLAAAKGALLYWTTASLATNPQFCDCLTDLQATAGTAGDPPACKVEEAKDANNYVGVRALNGGS
jgi:hypothetical protein